ncbi:IS630 transposase-related protein [Nitrospira sp. CMX1]
MRRACTAGSSPGGLTYQRPDPRQPRKLGWEQLRCHVEAHPDWTQAERARHFRVSRHCIWNALRKLGVAHKKKTGVFRTRPPTAQAVSPSSRAVRTPRQLPRVHR